jgi:hypothetical protein
MRYKKGFSYAKGTYYFTVKAIPNNITIYRKTKEAAADAYQKYVSLGKDIEWLGKWNGKQFLEATPPVSMAE